MYEAPSNEAPHMLLGYHWGHLGTLSDVPAIFDFSVNGNRLSQEPAWGIIWMFATSARLSKSDDYSFSGYLDRYLSTSVQHSGLRAWMIIGNLW